MGTQTTKDVLEAKRILVVGETSKIFRRALYGIVATTDIKKKTISIRHPQKDELWIIKTDSKTKFTKGTEKATLEDVQVGERLVAIGTLDKEANTLIAVLINQVPRKVEGLSTSATQAASPSPSSKASTSPSAKPSPKPTQSPTL